MKLRLLLALLATAYGAMLGLDLGQDFTKAALVAPGVPFEIVMSADSKRKDVSGLAFKPLGNDDDIERLYGSQTASYCTRFPQHCLLNLKPLLGKPVDDAVVQHYLSSHPGVEPIASKNNRSTIAFNIQSHTYPIEEVLAMSFQNILGRASSLLKEKSPGGYSQINDVAITVPGFFSQAQRAAIKDAAELAGLKVSALVDDGLAIAVNYATNREFQLEQKEYHVIYDMGAGSTKATLVSFFKRNETDPLEIVVEDYAYDETLGGSYFTNAIAQLITNKFLDSNPSVRSQVLHSNHRAIAKIYQAAEKAKLVLSANSEALVSIESIFEDIDLKTKISREDFEYFIADSSKRITQPLLDLNVKLEDLSSVIYAGGSTRVPFVQQHLLALIGEELVSKTINADEAAVLGATLRGVQVSKMFKSKEFNITQPTIYEYKIQTDDKEIVVFPEGTPYGTSKQIELDGIESFDLVEDVKRFIHYYEPSTINETCKYVGNFGVSESRLISFNLEEHCEDSKKVVPMKSKYIGPRPLGTASKQELRSHLMTLNTKDQQRKLISEKLNELEASLYDARAYLQEDEVLEKGPKDLIEEANSVVSEYLEWLDYESDDARSKEIKDKLEKVNTLKKQIKTFIDELSVSLDAEEFEKVHQEGVVIMNQIQETLLRLGEETLEISKKFAENGLDFEKEVKKLKGSSITPDKIEKASSKLMKVFEKVKELYTNPESLEKLAREVKFNLRKDALNMIEEIQRLEKSLLSFHSQRMKDLNGIFSKFIRAQKRAASKSKQEEEPVSTIESSTTSSIEEESVTETNTVAEHDEL